MSVCVVPRVFWVVVEVKRYVSSSDSWGKTLITLLGEWTRIAGLLEADGWSR